MGTEGMKTSLISREVITGSIEHVGRGYMVDALVCLVGCDKTFRTFVFSGIQCSRRSVREQHQDVGQVGNPFAVVGVRYIVFFRQHSEHVPPTGETASNILGGGGKVSVLVRHDVRDVHSRRGVSV